MSQLTKQQRHKIYKKALELYSPEDKTYNLLCCCIIKVISGVYATLDSETFPEFFKFKPNELFEGEDSLGNFRFSMWWPGRDTNSRRACLEYCIKVTAPKQNLFTQLKQWICKLLTKKQD